MKGIVKVVKKRIKKGKDTFHVQSFIVGVAGVFLLVGIFALMSKFGILDAGVIGEKKAGEIMKELAEKNLTKAGTEVAIENVSFKKDLGFYEVKMKLGNTTEIAAFLSGDGNYFVEKATSLVEIEQKVKAQREAAAQEATKKKNVKIPKTEKPTVEVFVMSHCPFGTQVQKGFLPVMKTLGSKADISFKFVDYLMHGKKELDENLNQYCIEKEESEKHQAYLECFLGSKGEVTDSTKCMQEVGISENEIKKCTASTDKEFGISEKFADKATWNGGKYPLFDLQKGSNEKYKIGGSPTVVVNGAIVEPKRDPNSLLASVCSGFETQPKECKESLSTKAPSPGFGVGTATSVSGDAGCEG